MKERFYRKVLSLQNGKYGMMGSCCNRMLLSLVLMKKSRN